MNQREHWEAVYRRKGPSEVSWYRPHLDRSLHFIEIADLSPESTILDVGGGPSTLVDDLLDRGYRNVTVLDLSERAIEQAKERLGETRQASYLDCRRCHGTAAYRAPL